MIKALITFTLIWNLIMAQTSNEELNNEIQKGNFTKAAEIISDMLKNNNITKSEEELLLFEIERMERIKKDFKLSRNEVMDYVRKFIPEADDKMIEGWEKDGSLEFIIIDGVKRYFNRSHTNLFRINRTAKIRKAEVSGKSKDDLDLLLENLVPDILSDIESRNGNSGKAEKIKLNYQVSVPPGIVPEGEIIRCWLPYPREGTGRQEIIDFHSEDEFIISDNSNLQRSVYFEKIAESNKPTVFSYNLVISTQAESFSINEFSVNEYAKDSSYFYHISERPPHIVFTDKIKNLSEKIIGNEKNPYLAAKKIFSWISKNIPWAGAREYSTIRNISDYAITNMHGDCGIKTILFMTLARYNGIPTKWQSGWMLHPGEVNLHDWGEIYFEGYGWVPVDQSFGLIDSEDPKIKYFYLGGIDQYRFTVNDDYSRPLYPAKIFPRSETVDFQRGEVEWSGGNLYFDKWDYSMEIEYLTE